MPKASKGTASAVEQGPGFEGHYEDLDGTTVGWERFDEDMDPAPLFRGLPDDRCQSRHWGVVLKGRIAFRYADGDEVVEAGEAYSAMPGHTPALAAGTEIIEFSPTDELARTMEVVMRNLAASAPSA